MEDHDSQLFICSLFFVYNTKLLHTVENKRDLRSLKIMLQRSTSTRILCIGLTSCIVILSFVVYNNSAKEGKKKSEKKDSSSANDESSDKSQQQQQQQQQIIANGNGDKKENGENYSCSPMFEYTNTKLTREMLDMACHRAKRWLSFRVSSAQNMVGQVGGKSQQKRPVLIFETFVMKPANLDHRGIREIAFYEAIQATHARNKRSGFQIYCKLFGPRDNIIKSPSSSSSSSSVKNYPFSYFTRRKEEVEKKEEDTTQPCCDMTKVENETKLLHRLELFTPKYVGTTEYDDQKLSSKEQLESESIDVGVKSNTYIILNNLTTHFSKPCVLDLKIGTETYEPDATDEKRSREMNKYHPQQTDFGFRMVAMRIYDPSNAKAGKGGYVYYPKQFGRSLDTRESVKDALRTFLGGENLPKDIKKKRSSAIIRIVSKLKLIRGWFRDNDVLAFYGSSILIIYEGETDEKKETGNVQLDMGRAKMIDFGRVRRQPGGDPGYRKGINTLIVLLEEILKESFWSDNYNYIE